MKYAQSLVVNFVVFRREVELQSFCSAILILSPEETVFFLFYILASFVFWSRISFFKVSGPFG